MLLEFNYEMGPLQIAMALLFSFSFFLLMPISVIFIAPAQAQFLFVDLSKFIQAPKQGHWTEATVEVP